jgi:site-specific recombinase XerD
VLAIAGQAKPLARSALHTIVKQVFRRATDQTAEKEDGAHLASRLRWASVHWLRHTAGSRMDDVQMDLRHVRDNLGHESLKTTSGHLHSADEMRHRETQSRYQLGWS